MPAPPPSDPQSMRWMRLWLVLLFVSVLSSSLCGGWGGFLRCDGATWDRGALPAPVQLGSHFFQLPLTAENLFGTALREQEWSRDDAGAAAAAAAAASNASHTLFFMLSGLDKNVQHTQASFVLAWPNGGVPPGERPPQWAPLPLIGAQPASRDSAWMVLVPRSSSSSSSSNSVSSSSSSGLALLFGGESAMSNFASLWALDLSRGEWIPLGPPRMPAQDCGGRPSVYREATLPAKTEEEKAKPPSIDACYWSARDSPQEDEFGCPWPAARQLPNFVVVGDYAYMTGGTLMDWFMDPGVWRLQLRGTSRSAAAAAAAAAHNSSTAEPAGSSLWDAVDQQRRSRNGRYTYNADQLRFLRDRDDPSIDRAALCPVHWEQLTRPQSASLLSRPLSDPYPSLGRGGGAALASGTRIFLVGGWYSFETSDVKEEVWCLETAEGQMHWTLLSIAPIAASYAYPSSPAQRALFGNFIVQLPRLEGFIDMSVDPSYAACGNRSTAALLVLGGITSTGDRANDAWLLLPPCDAIPDCASVSDANPACSIVPHLFPDPSIVAAPGAAAASPWSWHRSSVHAADWAPASAQVPSSTGAYFMLPPNSDGHSVVLQTGGMTDAGTMEINRLYDLQQHSITDLTSQGLAAAAAASASPGPFVLPTTLRLASAFEFRVNGRSLMLLFGGRIPGYVQSDVWSYDVRSRKWAIFASANRTENSSDDDDVHVGDWPPPTQGAVYAATAAHVYMYGGARMPSEIAYVADLFGWLVPPTGSGDLPCNNEVWRFDVSARRWTNLSALVGSDTRWPLEDDAAAVAADPALAAALAFATGGQVHDGKIYPRGRCFAGGDVLLDDDAAAADTAVVNDSSHGSGAALYVFGGVTGVLRLGSSIGVDNALWQLNLTSLRWTLLQRASNFTSTGTMGDEDRLPDRPSPRTRHVFRAWNRTHLLTAAGTGGQTGAVPLSGVWLWSTRTSSWTRVASFDAPASPPGRIAPAACILAPLTAEADSLGTQPALLIYGGAQSLSSSSSDIWLLEQTPVGEWRWHEVSATSTASASSILSTRTGSTLLALRDNAQQTHVIMHGGSNTDYDAHWLDLERASVGAPLSRTTGVAHDWLAVLENASDLRLQLPTQLVDAAEAAASSAPNAAAASTATAASMFLTVPVLPRSFATLTGALQYMQESLQSNGGSVRVLSRSTGGGGGVLPSANSSSVQQFLPCPLRALSGFELRINASIVGMQDGSSVLTCACAEQQSDCSMRIGGTAASASSASARSSGTHVSLQDVTLRGASSSYGGALSVSSASASLERVQIVDALATRAGGALFARNSDISMQDCVIQGNTAALFGGAVAAINSAITVRGGHFTNNSVDPAAMPDTAADEEVAHLYGQGGALCCLSSTVALSDVRFASNRARVGGALVAAAFATIIAGVSGAEQTATVVVRNASFSGNAATEDGGALYLAMMRSQDRTVLAMDIAAQMAGMAPSTTADATAASCTTSGEDDDAAAQADAAAACTAAAWVSAAESAPVQLLDSSFVGNVAGVRGGAVALVDSFLFSNASSFVGNSAGVAGGALSWQPQQTDEGEPWSAAPVLLHTRNNSNASAASYFSPLAPSAGAVCSVSCNATWCVDAACNSAMYGALLSSPAASLRLLPSSFDAALQLQVSGSVVTPPLVVELIDAYGQRVSSDSSTFVAVGPSVLFSGATSVQVNRGVATFDAVMLRAPPNVSVEVSFTASRVLPQLVDDVKEGRLRLVLKAARSTQSGLQMQVVSGVNQSFAHVSSCATPCAVTLPSTPGTHAAFLTLVFRTDLFKHEYDSVSVNIRRAMDADSLTPYEQVFHATGTEILDTVTQRLQAGALGRTSAHALSSLATTAVCLPVRPSCLLLSLSLSLPSSHVQVVLQTGDDAVVYLSGTWQLYGACPVGLRLHAPSDECFDERQTSPQVRGALVALNAVALALVLIVALLVGLWREQSPIRAAQPKFLLFLLASLSLLPIAGFLFFLIPHDDSFTSGSSGVSSGGEDLCVARLCCLSLSLAGVLSVLLAKALRLVLVRRSVSLAPTRFDARHMTAVICVVVALELALCIVARVLSVSQSALLLEKLPGDLSSTLVLQCSQESAFVPWLVSQITYLSVLAFVSAYVAFRSRGVPAAFAESAAVGNALFLLLLGAAILLPVGVLVQSSPTAILIVQAGGCVLLTCTFLGTLFVPRLLEAAVLSRRVQQTRGTPNLRIARFQPDITFNGVGHSAAAGSPDGKKTTARRQQQMLQPQALAAAAAAVEAAAVDASSLALSSVVPAAGVRHTAAGSVPLPVAVELGCLRAHSVAGVPEAILSPAAAAHPPFEARVVTLHGVSVGAEFHSTGPSELLHLESGVEPPPSALPLSTATLAQIEEAEEEEKEKEATLRNGSPSAPAPAPAPLSTEPSVSSNATLSGERVRQQLAAARARPLPVGSAAGAVPSAGLSDSALYSADMRAVRGLHGMSQPDASSAVTVSSSVSELLR